MNEKDSLILIDFTNNIHSGNPYIIENSIKVFYKEYISVLNEMTLFQEALKNAEDLDYNLTERDSVLTHFKNREKNEISGLKGKSRKLHSNQQGITSVAPVICLTMVVWNVGVLINAAAAVNVAVGVNVAIALNAAVGVNVTFSGTNSSGGDTNTKEDNAPLPTTASNSFGIIQELELEDISVSENLVKEIIEATY